MLKLIDRNIIKIIGQGRLTASDIARKTGLGRTTLNYRLKLLLKWRLVSRSEIIGRKVLYSVNKGAVNEARESRLIQVFTGSNMAQAYRYFFEMPKNTVVYSVQGLDAIRRMIEMLPVEFINNAHKKQRNRKIILKGFINKKTLSILEGTDPKIIQSHIGRAVGLKLVEGDAFMGPCEVLCSQNVFLISDTAKKRSFVLREKTITRFLFEILSVFYDSSDNIQIFKLNDFWESLISKK